MSVMMRHRTDRALAGRCGSPEVQEQTLSSATTQACADNSADSSAGSLGKGYLERSGTYANTCAHCPLN